MEIRFSVPGPVRGKGRPRFAKVGGFVKTYTDNQTVNYENWVRLCYQSASKNMLDGDIEATIVARFAIPKSRKLTEYQGSPCTKKPDCDNIAKVILDSLNGIAYRDDAAIWSMTVSKCWDIADQVDVTLKGE